MPKVVDFFVFGLDSDSMTSQRPYSKKFSDSSISTTNHIVIRYKSSEFVNKNGTKTCISGGVELF